MDESQKARACYKQAYNLYADLFGEDSCRAQKAKSQLEQLAEA